MRRVGTFYDAEEAQIAAGFLRSHGLDARLPDERTLAVQPELRFALGGYRLEVPAGEAAEAERLLAGVRARPSGHGLCSACGHDALRRERGWGVTALLSLIAWFPFSPARTSLRCTACGHRQPADDDTLEREEPA